MSSIENKHFAFNEMMTHIPLCTHKEPHNILVVGNVDTEFKNEVAKHKVNAEYGDTSIITSKNDKTIDVIIFASGNLDELLLANIQKILKDDGVIAFVSESFNADEAKLKADLTLAGSQFWIAMPFKFNHTTAILASKKYHPTADIVLQVSDLLDDLNYYSTEVHHASFVFPAYIHRKLTGIAKR
jgi:spermidine synthase